MHREIIDGRFMYTFYCSCWSWFLNFIYRQIMISILFFFFFSFLIGMSSILFYLWSSQIFIKSFWEWSRVRRRWKTLCLLEFTDTLKHTLKLYVCLLYASCIHWVNPFLLGGFKQTFCLAQLLLISVCIIQHVQVSVTKSL